MESRKLDIIIHSANNLNDVKFLGTIDPYAVFWIVGSDNHMSKKCKTPVAKNAVSPVWDCPMEFDIVPMKSNYVLFCEIQHDGTLLDRKIGEVHVPFTDLLAGDGSGNKVSYPVKISSGKVKGEIIISHKFLEPVVVSCEKDGDEKVSGKMDRKVKKKKKFQLVKLITQTVGVKDGNEDDGDSNSESGSESESSSDHEEDQGDQDQDQGDGGQYQGDQGDGGQYQGDQGQEEW